MAKTIDTNIDDGFLLFTFTNNQGEIFSSFKLNPTDINVAARAEEIEPFLNRYRTAFRRSHQVKKWRI